MSANTLHNGSEIMLVATDEAGIVQGAEIGHIVYQRPGKKVAHAYAGRDYTQRISHLDIETGVVLRSEPEKGFTHFRFTTDDALTVGEIKVGEMVPSYLPAFPPDKECVAFRNPGRNAEERIAARELARNQAAARKAERDAAKAVKDAQQAAEKAAKKAEKVAAAEAKKAAQGEAEVNAEAKEKATVKKGGAAVQERMRQVKKAKQAAAEAAKQAEAAAITSELDTPVLSEITPEAVAA